MQIAATQVARSDAIPLVEAVERTDFPVTEEARNLGDCESHARKKAVPLPIISKAEPLPSLFQSQQRSFS